MHKHALFWRPAAAAPVTWGPSHQGSARCPSLSFAEGHSPSHKAAAPVPPACPGNSPHAPTRPSPRVWGTEAGGCLQGRWSQAPAGVRGRGQVWHGLQLDSHAGLPRLRGHGHHDRSGQPAWSPEATTRRAAARPSASQEVCGPWARRGPSPATVFFLHGPQTPTRTACPSKAACAAVLTVIFLTQQEHIDWKT